MNTYVVRSRIVWGLICVASFLGQSLLYAQPEKADEALFTRASQLAAEVENLRSVSVPAEVFRVVNNPYVIWQYQGQKFQVLDKAAQMTTQFREMTAALKRIYYRQEQGNPAFYMQFGAISKLAVNVFNQVSTLQWAINETYSFQPSNDLSVNNLADVVTRLKNIEELKWQILYIVHIMQHNGQYPWTESGVQWMQSVSQNSRQAESQVLQSMQSYLQQNRQAAQDIRSQGGYANFQQSYFKTFFGWIQEAQQKYRQLGSFILVPDFHPWARIPNIMPGPKGNVPFCIYEYLTMAGKNPFEGGQLQEFGKSYQLESLPFWPENSQVPYLPPGGRPSGYQVPQGMPSIPPNMQTSGISPTGWGPNGSSTPPVSISPSQTIVINTGGPQTVVSSPSPGVQGVNALGGFPSPGLQGNGGGSVNGQGTYVVQPVAPGLVEVPSIAVARPIGVVTTFPVVPSGSNNPVVQPAPAGAGVIVDSTTNTSPKPPVNASPNGTTTKPPVAGKPEIEW